MDLTRSLLPPQDSPPTPTLPPPSLLGRARRRANTGSVHGVCIIQECVCRRYGREPTHDSYAYVPAPPPHLRWMLKQPPLLFLHRPLAARSAARRSTPMPLSVALALSFRARSAGFLDGRQQRRCGGNCFAASLFPVILTVSYGQLSAGVLFLQASGVNGVRRAFVECIRRASKRERALSAVRGFASCGQDGRDE